MGCASTKEKEPSAVDAADVKVETKLYKSGSFYEGSFDKAGLKTKGTYTFADGETQLCFYDADAPTGLGVRWSADRTEAWKLNNGMKEGKVSLEEAAKIAKEMGLAVPGKQGAAPAAAAAPASDLR